MNKTYIKRFQKLSEELRNPKLSEYARIENENTFTRNRKMPLNDIYYAILQKKDWLQNLSSENISGRKKRWIKKYQNKRIFSKGNV